MKQNNPKMQNMMAKQFMPLVETLAFETSIVRKPFA
jgi:hypothetical protein